MTSTIKVNTITTESGSTLTVGGCGKTVALASGASQTGFGRTGTVDWQTGSIKTGDFTAVNGQGFFVDTTSSVVTVTLPSSPSAGNIVAVADYAGTSNIRNITIDRNGSPIEGGTDNATLDVSRESKTFVYVDSTQGWVVVNSNDASTIPPEFLTATGGNETISGNCKIHTFTGPGTFVVCVAGRVAANNEVSYMVIAGGGGGKGGGGGAGGYRETKSPVTPYTASPLDGQPSAPNRVTVTATSFPITVGGGGAGQLADCGPIPSGAKGSNSIFSTITSTGGGSGRDWGNEEGPSNNYNGGSGGGGGQRSTQGAVGGTGNTPSTTPAQGTNGGLSQDNPGTNGGAGGGGGAGGVGVNGTAGNSGAGGPGTTSSIDGTPTVRAGGGGGGGRDPGSNAGAGGSGGGGTGTSQGPATATAGTANTGGGGGGGGYNSGYGTGGNGGSGLVIIRYKIS